MFRRRLIPVALIGALSLVPVACGNDSGPSSSASGIPSDRCEANRAAGTITYLSSFDFAAAASIVEVVLAEKQGYFTDLCLDVELKPSFSTANYPIVAGNEAQFSSSGSFTELAEFNAANDADLVGLSVAGRTAIDTLIVKPDRVTTYADLKGTTIGVKGKLPPSIKALLAKNGLVEGTDFTTVLLEGFDPKVHYALDGIVGFPGWKSNEPGQLDAAGITYSTFDPTKEGIPGSFGLLYTNRQFLAEHPTAVQDFMRAAMRALADAIADPTAAATACFEKITAGGNQNYLSIEGETFRWKVGAELIAALTPAGTPLGMPDLAGLQAEVDAYDAVGVFAEAGGKPATDGVMDVTVLQAIYGTDGKVIWPY